MPKLQQQIETLRKKIAAYRTLQEQGEDFAEWIEALERGEVLDVFCALPPGDLKADLLVR